MKVSEISRLSDDALRSGLRSLVAQDRTTTVRLLIHMAEFDSRRLYRADGFPSMHAYCVGELRMSDDVAYKRICAARRARKFPRIFVCLHDGTLTLSAVAMLSRYLSSENAHEMLGAAENKTNAQIAELIAQRSPRPDLPTLVEPLKLRARESRISTSEPATEQRALLAEPKCQELAARRVALAIEPTPPRPSVMPLAPERYGVQFSISKSDRELLRRAQDLLSHQMASRDEGEIFVHALRLLVQHLERRKFAATDKPRKDAPGQHPSTRYIPAHVRRFVSHRDGGRCTFTAGDGRRCEARGFLEFDHVFPVARGGKSTVDNLRLRCRAHNQLEAEKCYGADFMRGKIDGVRPNPKEAYANARESPLPQASP
jgi:HNH endonuclease